jgi:hypothetical protein
MLSLTRRISISARGLGLFAAAALLAIVPSAAFAQNTSLRVVHGIPGGDVSPDLDPELPVDVMVNDAICLLSGFTFGEVEGPFTIPGGTYNVKVSLANTLAPCSEEPVIQADVPINAGSNVSIVAHLDAEGAPTASLFTNEVSRPAEGNARLIAHHVAAAPTVDLLVPGRFSSMPFLTVPGVSNTAGMNQATAEINSQASVISILAPGGQEPLFFRVVSLKPGVTYTAYAVGSLTNGTFTLIVEPIGGLKGFTTRF